MEWLQLRQIDVEICIEAAAVEDVTADVTAAREGGASRIELCANMKAYGLTPAPHLITAAKKAAQSSVAVQVMIRPRPGDFDYSEAEIRMMVTQIQQAARAGAAGVVWGVTQDGRLAALKGRLLTDVAQQAGLSVTFHRAFDTLGNPLEAVERLIEWGIQRILTSGTTWSSQAPVTQGLEKIQQFLDVADGRVEFILGGGVQLTNTTFILQNLSIVNAPLSLHAYSAVLVNGRTSKTAVVQLCTLARVTDTHS